MFAFAKAVFGFGNEGPKYDIEHGFEHPKEFGSLVVERFGAHGPSEMAEGSFNLGAFLFAGETNHADGSFFFGRQT